MISRINLPFCVRQIGQTLFNCDAQAAQAHICPQTLFIWVRACSLQIIHIVVGAAAALSTRICSFSSVIFILRFLLICCNVCILSVDPVLFAVLFAVPVLFILFVVALVALFVLVEFVTPTLSIIFLIASNSSHIILPVFMIVISILPYSPECIPKLLRISSDFEAVYCELLPDD